LDADYPAIGVNFARRNTLKAASTPRSDSPDAFAALSASIANAHIAAHARPGAGGFKLPAGDSPARPAASWITSGFRLPPGDDDDAAQTTIARPVASRTTSGFKLPKGN